MRKRSYSRVPEAVSPVPAAESLTRKPRLSGRQLDLMILAGCSCLLTVVCHPADTIKAIASSSAAVMESHVQSHSAGQASAIAYTVPSKTAKIEDDDEEEI